MLNPQFYTLPIIHNFIVLLDCAKPKTPCPKVSCEKMRVVLSEGDGFLCVHILHAAMSKSFNLLIFTA